MREILTQFRPDQYLIISLLPDKGLTNEVHEGDRKGRGFSALKTREQMINT